MPHIFQKMKALTDVIIHLHFGLELSIDWEIGSGQKTYSNAILKLIENLFGDWYVLFLKFEELEGDEDALIEYFMVVMLEISKIGLKLYFRRMSNLFLLTDYYILRVCYCFHTLHCYLWYFQC